MGANTLTGDNIWTAFPGFILYFQSINGKPFLSVTLDNENLIAFQVGEQAYVHLANIKPVNAAGIGCVTLDEKGAPIQIEEAYADGSRLSFVSQEPET